MTLYEQIQPGLGNLRTDEANQNYYRNKNNSYYEDITREMFNYDETHNSIENAKIIRKEERKRWS